MASGEVLSLTSRRIEAEITDCMEGDDTSDDGIQTVQSSFMSQPDTSRTWAHH